MADGRTRQAENVAAVPADELRAAQLLWASVDSPWVHNVDAGEVRAARCRGFGPSTRRGSSARTCRRASGDHAMLFETLLDAPNADPFVGPDQAALEAMLRQFEPV